MTDNTDTHPPEVDPFEVAAEQLLYGDPTSAAAKLREAVFHGAAAMSAHQARQSVIQREHASSKAVAERFATENPEWAADVMVRDAVKAGMRVEQLNDLMKAGIDIGKWSESLQRVPSETDIFNAHRDLRAVGNPNVRTPEQLFEDVASQIEGKFGIRRRLRDADHNRSRAARDIVNERRRLRGLSPENFSEPARPSQYDRGTTATEETLAAMERRHAGFDADDGVDAAIAASRKKAIADRLDRNLARDRNVRFSRTADDRRYPDRRSAAG